MTKIENSFVTYQQSIDMRLINFDEPCLAWYQDKTLRVDVSANQSVKLHQHLGRFQGCVITPPYSQVFEWFRVNHNLFCTINVDQTMEPKFCYSIMKYSDSFEWETLVFNSDLYYEYQQAESACLDELIKITKS